MYFRDNENTKYPDGVEFEDIFQVTLELVNTYEEVNRKYREFYRYNNVIDNRVNELYSNIPYDKLIFDYANNYYLFMDNFCFKWYYGQLNDEYKNKLNEYLKKIDMEYVE